MSKTTYGELLILTDLAELYREESIGDGRPVGPDELARADTPLKQYIKSVRNNLSLTDNV